MCGHLCGQGQVCNHGSCAVLPDDCTLQSQGCGAGYFCDPVTKKCLTGCRLSTDCPMGATCTQGTCGCPTGQHACGQSCVSDTSISSCGSRCSVCPSPANSTVTCTTGTCGFTCASGFREQNGLCVDLDECATNNGNCSANAACTNTPGSRTCTCNTGFSGDGVTCTDLNECLTNNGGCAADASCTNTPGSRTCACNPGFTGNGTTCTDVNECATNNGGCSTNATCTNLPGTRSCACNVGFTGDGVSCTDLNECATNNGGCAATSSGGVCTNTPGSRTCACATGYSGDGFTCMDINECATNNGGCAPTTSGGLCTNTPGSRTCACATGFTGNGTTCTDINECLTNNGGCAAASSGGVCTNTPGNRTCACATGFTGDGFTCTDINECLTNNGGCAPTSSGGICTNTPGNRTCTCATGFAGNGTTCADINECLTNNGGCSTNATCANTPGSRTCTCNAGFAGDGLTCVPNGDSCAASIPLTLSVATNGNSIGAVNDYTGPLSALCGGQSFVGPDVVYSFTPAATQNFRVTTMASGYSPTVYASSTCGSAASCTALGGPAFNFHGTAGAPVFLTVDSSSSTLAGLHTITVTPVTAPTNDLCSSPTPLTLGTPVSGSFSGAVNDLSPSNACSTSFSSSLQPEVFFSFTPSTSGSYVFNETSGSDVVMWVATACDGSCVALNDEPEQMLLSLTAGQSYFFVVEPYSGATTFTVSVNQVVTPPNDTCAAPTPLTVSVPTNGSSLGGANDYAGATSAICGGQPYVGPDVVYSFTPSATQNYRVTSSASGFSPVIYVSSSCGAPASCTTLGSTNGFNFHGTASTPVFLTVDSTSSTQAGTHTITVAPVTGPSNDLCASATPLSLGTPVTGSFVGAVNDLMPTATCSSGFSTSVQPEVFFSFTPSTSGSYVFNETSGSDLVMWIATACDGSCLALTDDPEQLAVTLTAGQTYFFVVEPYSGATTFTVTVNQVVTPPNDTCATPTPLTVSVPTNGNSLGGANDYAGATSAICGGQPYVGPDVVYSFTPSATQNYRVTTSSTGFSPAVYVSSSCGAPASCTALGSTNAFNFHGTASTPVFLTVDSSAAAQAGLHTVTVAPVTAPSNDLCASPIALTRGTPVSGSFSGAVNDVMPTSTCSSSFSAAIQPEVFFTFTPSTSGSYAFTETSSSDVVMWVGTACDGTCLALTDEPEQLVLSLTAGQTYYFVVEPYSGAAAFTVVVN